MDCNFWRNRRVLVTGHTGFKGAWLALWLHHLGAKITGLSLHPHTFPNLFTLANLENCCQHCICNISDAEALKQQIVAAEPEIVFHMAAQALVRPSYQAPLETFAINTMGVAHVLDALRFATCRVAVMITTDKVYHNNEWSWPYRENDALGGHDPYSASKASGELIIDYYRNAFLSRKGIAVASARAGNVIGGGDWGEDRLIPDAVRAWGSDGCLTVRRPRAVRPWQHVLEPLAGYLSLAHRLWEYPELAEAYNFGPNPVEAATVREVVELARNAYGVGEVYYEDTPDGPHEAGHLALDNSKAREVLGLRPKWSLSEAVRRTMCWYKAQQNGANAMQLCLDDIAAYEATP